MAVWQIMMGLGVGFVAAMLMVVINTRQNRQIKQRESTYTTPPMDPCPICLENMSNERMTYFCYCGHAVHDECLKKMRENNIKMCPTCRKAI